jgi:membrane protein
MDSLPGALLAAIGWLVFSHLFSLYVEYFPGKADLYGSVYAAALCMLWLYFCIRILLYGGLLNHWIRQTDFRK